MGSSLDNSISALPNREDPIYIEIEQFKDYELTQCIAYEMAIRNNNAKEIFEELSELNEIREAIYNPDNYSDSQREEMQKGHKYWRLDEEQYFDKLAEKIINDLGIYPRGYEKRNTDYNNEIRFNQLLHGSKDPSLYKHNIIKNDGYTIFQGAHSKNEEFDINYIHTNFKRHLLDINQMQVSLNFSLPKDELIAYISKIKDDYDTDKSIIKNPIELIGKKLKLETKSYQKISKQGWADCFFIYDYFNISPDKTKETTYQKLQELLNKNNGMKIEKNKSELKTSKTKGDNSKYKIVQYLVYEEGKRSGLYEHKKVKPYYSTKTIRDRFKLMSSLIDDKEYKTLFIY